MGARKRLETANIFTGWVSFLITKWQLCERTNGNNVKLVCKRQFIHPLFISGMHHYECVAINIDINLQSGRFWAKSTPSFRERLNDSRSCWIVFIHIVRGRPGGLLQFFRGEAVKIFIASVSSGSHAMWLNRERRHAWTMAERGHCSVVRLTSSFRTTVHMVVPFDSQQLMQTPLKDNDMIHYEHISQHKYLTKVWQAHVIVLVWDTVS